MEKGVGRVLARHFAKMGNADQIDAYAAILLGLTARGYQAVPKAPEAGKNDVHFAASDGNRPYAFIVNANDLLFYFRRTAKKPALSALGLDAQLNKQTGEMTLSVSNEADAVLLLKALS